MPDLEDIQIGDNAWDDNLNGEFQTPLPKLGKKKSSKKISKHQCRGLGCDSKTCPANQPSLKKKTSKTFS